MGSLPLTLGTGILAAAALTPSAYAADGGGVSVAPAAPAPGADVDLRVTGCDTSTGTAVSDAFLTDSTLTGPSATLMGSSGTLTGSSGVLTGRARIRPAAPAGPHDVRIACGGTRITGTVTVAGDGSGTGLPTDDARPGGPPTAPPSAPSAAPPSAPVDAAGGDTAYFASVAVRSAGPGLVHAVIGVILVGLAAVVVGLRSARRGRDKD
ncbi:hypothetical protein [Streptomyces sp. NPDC001508]|uniref:hypothetical protein n=1 Tax=Streptomyces sp. NPDC001508 TaxID=3154656 RepID=UPI003323A492